MLHYLGNQFILPHFLQTIPLQNLIIIIIIPIHLLIIAIAIIAVDKIMKKLAIINFTG